jgi:peroxiredoxin
MNRHPNTRTLNLYMDGELGALRRRRVSEHLAECQPCRGKIQAWRAIGAALREDAVPELPQETLEHVRARRAAGSRVLLPAAVTRRPRVRVFADAAAAAALLLAVAGGLTTMWRTPELAAEGSQLLLAPAAPRPGQVVKVEYRAAGKLAGEERLILRARLFRSEPNPYSGGHATLAVLARTGARTYTGSFQIPDSVVYASLAVEDPKGDLVDYDPAAWEVLVHGADGKPLAVALERKVEGTGEWDSSIALRTTRELTRLYPDSTAGWMRRYSAEKSMLDRVRGDSLTAVFHARFRTLEAKRAETRDARELARLAFFATALHDSASEARWSDRLIRLAPTSPEAVQWRVFNATSKYRGDRAALLAALEALWTEAGGASPQLYYTGFTTARASGDPAAILRWARRLEESIPSFAGMVARMLPNVPALRNEREDRLRAQIRRQDQDQSEYRLLGHTRTDFQTDRARTKSALLGDLGRSLIESGRVAPGLDTLSHAAATGWDVGVFRTIANTRFAIGDTAGALPVLARVAVDPSTSATFVDSVKVRAARHFDPSKWTALEEDARSVLGAYVWAQSINRGLRAQVRLTDSSGTSVTFRAENRTPTLVAFWSRYCPPSSAQLRELDRVSSTLQSSGIRVVTITKDESSAAVSSFLGQAQYRFPAFLDPDGDAARAFDNQITPRYFVLDGAGRIRFDNYSPDDILRQVAALRSPR